MKNLGSLHPLLIMLLFIFCSSAAFGHDYVIEIPEEGDCLKTSTGKTVYVYLPHVYGAVPQIDSPDANYSVHERLLLMLWEPITSQESVLPEQGDGLSGTLIKFPRSLGLYHTWYGTSDFRWGLYVYRLGDEAKSASNIFVCAPVPKEYNNLPPPSKARKMEYEQRWGGGGPNVASGP